MSRRAVGLAARVSGAVGVLVRVGVGGVRCASGGHGGSVWSSAAAMTSFSATAPGVAAVPASVGSLSPPGLHA